MNNTEQNLQSFFEGTNYFAQDFFGVHEENDFYVFRVFAPRAVKVMLTGDFNDWRDDTPMEKISERGVFEKRLPIEKFFEGSRYKYRIYGNGQVHYKTDPFSKEILSFPENSSLVIKRREYEWKDAGWLEYRKRYQSNIDSKPINMYGVHLASWRHAEKGRVLNYKDYAREMAPYVKQMGYTHISLTPIMEYSNEESMGYIPSSFFSPTLRYGSAEDFKAFVDKMHEAGIGVVFDWPITGFSDERFGLLEFDGAPLYEYVDAETDGVGVRRFDFSKNEVRSFLISSALYWVREYHVDAIKISNVDMIFKSYADKPSDIYEKNAIDFFAELKSVMKREYPDVFLIAQGSLGKENEPCEDMTFGEAWAEDMLYYTSLDPFYRSYHHDKLIGSFYGSGDRVSKMLSISNKSVCLGKRSLIENMAGDYWQKFANARALLGLMMTAVGKKLLFMSSEIAQFKEWSYDREVEWFLLDYESHEKFQRYVAELNNFYLSHSALWERDALESGFEWIDANNSSQSIIAFRRTSEREELTVVINFTPVVYEKFRIGAEAEGSFTEIFNSDSKAFYGSGVENPKALKTEPIAYHGRKNSVLITVPPLGMTVLSFKRRATRRKKGEGKAKTNKNK